MSNQTSDLIRRIRNGNDWCRSIWQKCCDTANGDETVWRRNLAMFHAGTERLYILCLELEANGFTKCLYDKPLCLDTKEITCWACPVHDRSTIGRSAVMLDVTAVPAGAYPRTRTLFISTRQTKGKPMYSMPSLPPWTP